MPDKKKPKKKKEMKVILGLQNVSNLRDYRLYKNRIVILHGQIDEIECSDVAKRLIALSVESNKPIKVILNSVGGEVYHGLLVFDTIKDLVKRGIDVTVEARGLAASMGAVILQAGSKRLASRYTRFLIHEVSSIAFGKASEVEEQSKELQKVNLMLKEILAERTGKTPKEIEKVWHKRDFWMSSQKALRFGLIDSIV